LNRKFICLSLIILFAASAVFVVLKLRPQFLNYSHKPSILLIVIDTLRADHLGTYGYNKPTSPLIDEFAGRSVVYENAISPAPFTLPAMSSLFTGYYPDRTGVVSHSNRDILDSPMPTMAEIMKKAGYRTAAIVSNMMLKKASRKFDRGFDYFLAKKSFKNASAPQITDHAINLVKEMNDDPFFIWAHYIDTHMPYRPPIEFAQLFGNETGKSKICTEFNKEVRPQEIFFSKDLPVKQIESTRKLYDASIRSIDHEIGRLLKHLKEKNLLKNMIVIITADHGESLGDHGLYFAHDHTLYSELVHVPLIIRFPGKPPHRKSEIVSLIDILPSLCQWLKIDCDQNMNGQPLDLNLNKDKKERAVFAANAPWRKRFSRSPYLFLKGLKGRWTMIQQGKKKLIKIPHPTSPVYEFYDLSVDPTEKKNLQSSRSYESLLDKLNAWEKSVRVEPPYQNRQELKFDKNELESLRSMGYVN